MPTNTAESAGCVDSRDPLGTDIIIVCDITWGGGVDSSSASIENSTVSNNIAAHGNGGGLAGSMTATNVTLADNSAEWGEAIFGEIGLTGSAITGPAPACAFFAPVLPSGGHNAFPDASCLPNATDLVGVDLLLGPLADNGGSTLTHLPGVGSPATDAIPAGTAGLCDGTLPADQRGVARPTGVACDIGAVEQ